MKGQSGALVGSWGLLCIDLGAGNTLAGTVSDAGNVGGGFLCVNVG